MTTIDIGNGKTAQRHHLTKAMLSEFDQAAAAFGQAQAAIRAWIRPLTAMQAGAGVNGSFICSAPGQSGRTYALAEVGGAILVDQRDVAAFLGFTAVPTQQPNNPRVGLVFLDTATGEYLRWGGTTWSPTTME